MLVIIKLKLLSWITRIFLNMLSKILVDYALRQDMEVMALCTRVSDEETISTMEVVEFKCHAHLPIIRYNNKPVEKSVSLKDKLGGYGHMTQYEFTNGYLNDYIRIVKKKPSDNE